jgi:glyoxylase-like metal-dependent hydrolase (beta-lactamase superfamily II)
MKNNPYEVHQVDDSCWRIEENGVRSFLIIGSEKALLIDSGFGTGNIKELVDEMTKKPLVLVNTHADRDHIGCNALFEKAYMHPAEYDRYSEGAADGYVAEPLWENDRIDLGGRILEVILIPGHTPGSIALLDPENRVLFSGDSVQAGAIFMFGPGRNMQAYITSMTKLRTLSGRFDTVYPSHGPFPVRGDIIPALVAGAKKVLRGEVEGKKPEYEGLKAKLYEAGEAKFLCK